MRPSFKVFCKKKNKVFADHMNSAQDPPKNAWTRNTDAGCAIQTYSESMCMNSTGYYSHTLKKKCKR